MKKKYVKSALVITFITILCKILGFLRETLQAYFYGTSKFVDAFYSSALIITIFFSWLTCFSLSYTPVYMDVKNKDYSDEKINDLTNCVSTYTFIFSAVLFTICVCFPSFFVNISVPGFDEEGKLLSAKILLILSFSILFISLSKIYGAFLHCKEKYISSILPTLAINIVEIIFIIISSKTSIYFLAIGLVAAYIVEFLLFMIFCKRNGLKFRPNFKISESSKQIFLLGLPLLVNVVVTEICNFTDKLFASYLAEGAISSLAYANSLRKLLFSICTIGIVTIIYPKLSEHISKGDYKKAKESLRSCLRLLLLFGLPMLVGSMVLAKEIVIVAFQRGEFSDVSTSLTSNAFMAYSIGFVALCIQTVMIKALYSLKKTKTCTLINVGTVLINVVFDFLLIGTWGHVGLALATSISCIITLPVYFVVFMKSVGNPFFKKDALFIVLSIAASIAMGVIVYFAKGIFVDFVNQKFLVKLCILIFEALLGAIFYFLLLWIVKNEEMKLFIKYMIKKVRKNG